MEDSRDLYKILQVSRDQLLESPLLTRPLIHLECDEETGTIYSKPVEEVTEDVEEYGEPNDASNQSEAPLFAHNRLNQ